MYLRLERLKLGYGGVVGATSTLESITSSVAVVAAVSKHVSVATLRKKFGTHLREI